MSGLNYQFKYAPGDKVFIVRKEAKTATEACEACKGVGGATINEKWWNCPDCSGRGYQRKSLPIEFHAQPEEHTVGQVRLEYTDSPGREGEELFDNYKPKKKIEEAYMLVETGVGSGSIWYVHLLFPTFQEAEDGAMLLRAEEAEGQSTRTMGGPR